MKTTRPAVDLGGTWACEPLARTEFREHGELAADTSNLPPAGTATVPGNWYDGPLGDFHGRVRFSRELPPLEGDGWWLCFDGVDYLAEVEVDGALLARHEGAFDGFVVELPAGSRRLAVVVDAPREEFGTLWPYRKRQLKGIFTQWEPLEPFQATTGGIWGDVRVEQRPPVHVVDLVATTFLVPRYVVADGANVQTEGTDARVLIEVGVHAAEATSAVVVAELCGVRTERHVQVPAGSSSYRLTLVVHDPGLWWPWDLGEPVMHELDVRIGEDRVQQRVGLREVDYDESSGTVYVNREPVRVRGSNVIPEKWLARYDADRAHADVAMVRAANLNAVRVCVHVGHDRFYDACDEEGVLVWQDLPLQWDYLIDDRVIVEAADQAERIVRRLRPHACVALWSCHNEPFPADREHFAGPLLRAVRAADGTRPVHAVSDFSEHAYPGWFAGDVRDFALPAGSPIITEFGAQALPSMAEVAELGAKGWPPGGRTWDDVIPEPTALFDVAGVPIGDSLEGLIEATQHHQAAVVQRGVEAYRTQGRSFFHFMLMDGWPTVSWSVVSYQRTPKMAFATLARACQPILIGADLSRQVLSDAWDTARFPLILGVWVANDTREHLPGARWQARLAGQLIGEGVLDVTPSGVTRWVPPGQRWPRWQPPAMDEAAVHHLEVDLTDESGRVRSQNRYVIRFVLRDVDLQPPCGAC